MFNLQTGLKRGQHVTVIDTEVGPSIKGCNPGTAQVIMRELQYVERGQELRLRLRPDSPLRKTGAQFHFRR